MANTNAPFGLRPTMRTLNGGVGSTQRTHKIVGYGTALFIHDAVTHAASGTKNYPAIDAGITPGTTPVLGVNLIYGAASLATDHHIVRAKDGVFETQGDGTGATFLIAAAMNKNANLALTAGNTNTKMSKHELSETSINTTNTLDLRILGLVENPNNALGQYAVVFVSFNNLVDANQVAGI